MLSFFECDNDSKECNQIYGTVFRESQTVYMHGKHGRPDIADINYSLQKPKVDNLRKDFGLVSKEQTDDIDQIYLRIFSLPSLTAAHPGPSRGKYRKFLFIFGQGGVDPGAYVREGYS